jgi:hypothetical protein
MAAMTAAATAGIEKYGEYFFSHSVCAKAALAAAKAAAEKATPPSTSEIKIVAG